MSERTARRAVVALALAGAAIAGYLTYTHYRGITPVCATGGCEVVQTSHYAKVAGIPVAVIGLVGYLVLVALPFSRVREAPAVAVALALSGLGFAGYLLVVQLAVIDAVCIWCLASDIVMAVSTAATIAWLRAADAARLG